VSVAPEIGPERTITLADTTSSLDDPTGSNEATIEAYLPDGTQAKTDSDTPSQVPLELTEQLETWMQRQINKANTQSVPLITQLAADRTQGYILSKAQQAADAAQQTLVAGEMNDWAADLNSSHALYSSVGQLLNLDVPALWKQDPTFAAIHGVRILRRVDNTPPPTDLRIDVTGVDFNIACIKFENQCLPTTWHDVVQHPVSILSSPASFSATPEIIWNPDSPYIYSVSIGAPFTVKNALTDPALGNLGVKVTIKLLLPPPLLGGN
jgi:hypothetical protein